MSVEPKIDVCFQVIGKCLPVDHGFALYGAVSRHLPRFHEDQDVGLKLIRGRYIGNGLLDITPNSDLVIRMPVSRIGQYLSLAGKTLNISDHTIRIGVLNARALTPSPFLYAHLVSTRNGEDQDRFAAEIERQKNEFGAGGRWIIGKRRTFGIHGKQIVGYSLKVFDLSETESVAVQEQGLGGRRKMGCGFFEPMEMAQ